MMDADRRDALRSLRSASWLALEPQALARSNRGRCPSRDKERRFLDGHVGLNLSWALDGTLDRGGGPTGPPYVDLPQIYEAEPGKTLGRYTIRRILKTDGSKKITKSKV
jgi:hypothetical protein